MLAQYRYFLHFIIDCCDQFAIKINYKLLLQDLQLAMQLKNIQTITTTMKSTILMMSMILMKTKASRYLMPLATRRQLSGEIRNLFLSQRKSW